MRYTVKISCQKQIAFMINKSTMLKLVNDIKKLLTRLRFLNKELLVF